MLTASQIDDLRDCARAMDAAESFIQQYRQMLDGGMLNDKGIVSATEQLQLAETNRDNHLRAMRDILKELKDEN